MSTTRAWGVRGTPGGGSATAAACSSRSKASSWSDSGQVGCGLCLCLCTRMCNGCGDGGWWRRSRRGLVCGSFVCSVIGPVTPAAHGVCACKRGLDSARPPLCNSPCPPHVALLAPLCCVCVVSHRARRGSPGAARGVRPVSCKVHACGTCGVVVCVYPALVASPMRLHIHRDIMHRGCMWGLGG